MKMNTVKVMNKYKPISKYLKPKELSHKCCILNLATNASFSRIQRKTTITKTDQNINRFHLTKKNQFSVRVIVIQPFSHESSSTTLTNLKCDMCIVLVYALIAVCQILIINNNINKNNKNKQPRELQMCKCFDIFFFSFISINFIRFGSFHFRL